MLKTSKAGSTPVGGTESVHGRSVTWSAKSSEVGSNPTALSINIIMYIVDGNVANTVREPVCGRGGPYTADSVSGTGPGSACLPDKPPPTPPAPPPKRGCRVNVVVPNRQFYRASNGSVGLKVC